VRDNRDIFGLEHFTPHDLRRTAASMMTGMGISRLVVSKILNHVESGITAVYDRHSYDQEKRQALDAWGRKVSSIISGEKDDKVIELRA
jgi:integrase